MQILNQYHVNIMQQGTEANTGQTHGHPLVSRYLYCSKTHADHGRHACFTMHVRKTNIAKINHF